MVATRKSIFPIILLLLLPLAFSQSGEIRTFVNDYAEILNPQEEQELTSLLREISNSGVAEYSVVTVSSLEGESLESYSLRLAQEKLGSREKNNGLLLLVAVEDRAYRFEVGRGLEGTLNDAKIGRIGRDYLVPYFRTGNYGTGIVEASKSVKSILLAETTSEYYISADTTKKSSGLGKAAGWLFFFIPLFLIVFFIIKALKRGKAMYGSMPPAQRRSMFMRNRRFRRRRFGGGSSWGGGSRSGGGSFGGGGRFGGGGASGRW